MKGTGAGAQAPLPPLSGIEQKMVAGVEIDVHHMTMPEAWAEQSLLWWPRLVYGGLQTPYGERIKV